MGSAKPAIRGVDASARFAMQRWLLGERSQVEPFERKYNASLPILAAPLWWLGELGSHGASDRGASAVAHWNHLVLGGFLAWLYGRLRRGAGASRAAALTCVWVTLVSSLALPHSRDFYADLTWSAALLVAVDALASALAAPSPGARLTLGAASFVAAWTNPAVAPLWLGTSIGIGWLVRRRAAGAERGGARSALVAVAVGLGGALVAQATENLLERGNPLDGGYGGERFGFHPAGIVGLLVSPGKGAAFFLPQLALVPWVGSWRGWPDRLRSWARPRLVGAAMLSAGLVVLYGSWWSWGGGRYFGPRFLLLPSLAGAIVLGLAVSRWPSLGALQRVVVGVLLVHGCAVTVIGLAVNQRYFDVCTAGWEACHWSFAESPWWLLSRPWGEIGAVARSRGLASVALGSLALAAIVSLQRRADDEQRRTTRFSGTCGLRCR